MLAIIGVWTRFDVAYMISEYIGKSMETAIILILIAHNLSSMAADGDVKPWH